MQGSCPSVAQPTHFRHRGRKRHDDSLANLEVVDALPDSLDTTGRFVSEEHRRRSSPIAVDDGQVRMTPARCLDLDQDLPGPRAVESHVLDNDRIRLSIWPFEADGVQNCASDPQWGSYSVGVAVVIGWLPAVTGNDYVGFSRTRSRGSPELPRTPRAL
jgi:hypothetical protein